MKTEKYDKRALTDYLLGSGVESEIEAFDELSITDDEFAGALESAENDLIDAYLHGELEKADLSRFQANYLASPLRREKVEFARALQVLAEKNSAKTSIVSQTEKSASGFALWNAFSNLRLALRFGMAAIFVAFIGVFVWVALNLNNNPIEKVKVETTASVQPVQTPRPNEVNPDPTKLPNNSNAENSAGLNPSPSVSPSPNPTPEPTKQTIQETPKLATFVLLPPTRGAGNLQTISIPPAATDVAFNLPLETDEFKTFRVSLTDQAGNVLWQSGKLSSRKSSLNVRFPAKLLSTNIYSFSVVGTDDENAAQNIGNYSFRSVLK